ncbi:MAG: glucosamine kinase [Sphingobacteriales bacterium]|jgi:glucosamine kinase
MEVFIEAGGTKTEVCWKQDNSVERFMFDGIHPAAPKHIVVATLNQIKSALGEEVSSLHYYGTGVEVASFLSVLKDTLDSLFPASTVHIYSDLFVLVHAARKQGVESGAAAIFGTGSNFCVFNNAEVSQPFPALGYIMGDEGAGVNLGRILIQQWSRGLLSPETNSYLSAKLSSPKFQVSEIYGAEKPNKELASLVKKIDWTNSPELQGLVDLNFRSFFKSHQSGLVSPIICTGGIATTFASNLKKIGGEFNCEIVIIPRCLDVLLA